MFADLDEALRQLLAQRGQLDSGEVAISFEATTRDWAAGLSKPTVNLHLYQIRENQELRDPSAWRVRPGPNNTAIKARPPVKLDLTYMVTAWANSIEDEHRLLSRVLLTLMQHPVLPMELLSGAVEGQDIPTFTAQPNGVQSPADYWGALDQQLRACFEYRATATMDLGQEVTSKLVLTRQLRLGGLGGKPPEQDMPLQLGGRVYRRDQPEQGVSQATVSLLERALDTTTDGSGRYKFTGVPPGSYTLVIGTPGGQQQQKIQVPSEHYDVGVGGEEPM